MFQWMCYEKFQIHLAVLMYCFESPNHDNHGLIQIFWKWSCLIWSYLAHCLRPSSKNKKYLFWKKILYFLIFREMKLPDSNIKKFLTFSQKKTFLIFWEMKTQRNSLYFRKRNFLIFQEMKTVKKLMFQEVISWVHKNIQKKIKKWIFLAPKYLILLIKLP